MVTLESMYFACWPVERSVLVLGMCVLQLCGSIILGRHRVHPFGHTAHMGYPYRNKDLPKKHVDKNIKETFQTRTESPISVKEPAPEPDNYYNPFPNYKNTYGARIGDILPNKKDSTRKEPEEIHIGDPYIEISRKAGHPKKPKKIEYRPREFSTFEFQRVRDVSRKDKYMVSVFSLKFTSHHTCHV